MAAVSENADGDRTFKLNIQDEVFDSLKMVDTEFDDQATIVPLRQRPYSVKDGVLLNSPQMPLTVFSR